MFNLWGPWPRRPAGPPRVVPAAAPRTSRETGRKACLVFFKETRGVPPPPGPPWAAESESEDPRRGVPSRGRKTILADARWFHFPTPWPGNPAARDVAGAGKGGGSEEKEGTQGSHSSSSFPDRPPKKKPAKKTFAPRARRGAPPPAWSAPPVVPVQGCLLKRCVVGRFRGGGCGRGSWSPPCARRLPAAARIPDPDPGMRPGAADHGGGSGSPVPAPRPAPASRRPLGPCSSLPAQLCSTRLF